MAARMAYEQLGIRRAVLLGEADPHAQTAMNAWQDAFEALGGNVPGRFEDEVEFSDEVLDRLKTLKPEAIIFFPARELDILQAVQQALDTDVGAVIIGVESFTVHPAFLPVLGEATEGIYDAVPGVPVEGMPGCAAFAERYQEADFAIMPDPDHYLAKFSPSTYDAANLITAAICLAAETGEVTPESVAAAMETFREKPFQGVTGPIQFDEVGDLLDQPVYFKREIEGRWVDVVP